MPNGFSDIHRRKGKHINTKRLNRNLSWRKDVAHQVDEHIFVEDLLKATAIYMEAIYQLCK